MKTSIKISLLALAIVGALVGVLIYARTKVAPPKELTFKNQFVADVNKDISHVVLTSTDYSVDSLYMVVMEKVQFQRENGLITNKEGDELLANFLASYVPHYVTRCNIKFQQEVWHEDVLYKIKDHIENILTMTSVYGAHFIMGENKDCLKNVVDVIDNYFRAKSVAVVGGYHGISYAKEKINEAKKYLEMSPINNCEDLRRRLSTVKDRLQQAHYNYLVVQVDKLRHYRLYNSCAAYYDLAENVNDSLKEYEKDAKGVYGTNADIAGLKNRASVIYNEAQSYFKNNGIH